MYQAPESFKNCKNPKCNRLFPPRSNKHFCSLRCKNQYHNDQNRDPLNPLVQKNRRLKDNENILVRIALRIGLENVPKTILDYEGYDFNYFTSRTPNKMTKQAVHWIYSLGIEKSKTNETYTIHII